MSNSTGDIIQQVKSSQSHQHILDISNNMQGNTFHHHNHILYDLRDLLGKTSKVYMEIGTFNGGSLSLMLQNPLPTTLYCIDPLNHMPNQKEVLVNNLCKFNKYNHKVHIIQKLSDHAIQDVSHVTVDILYIDGAHDYNSVKQDFIKYEGLVTTGGFIVFDDYLDYQHSPDVKKAVDFIVASLLKSKYEVIGCIENMKNAFGNGINSNLLNVFILKKIQM